MIFVVVVDDGVDDDDDAVGKEEKDSGDVAVVVRINASVNGDDEIGERMAPGSVVVIVSSSEQNSPTGEGSKMKSEKCNCCPLRCLP